LNKRRALSLGAAAALTLSIATVPSPVVALDEVNSQQLRNRVDVGGIMAHQRVFQRIANQNGGTRASGTPGYEASANYVARTLRAAGYTVRKQEFTFPYFREVAPAVLSQVSPTEQDYETGTFTYSGSGDVTGVLVPANDNTVPPTAPAGETDAGCTPGSFDPAPAEDAVALVQRGTCDFAVKAANAEAAGYDAVIIFNEGQPGRTEAFVGTLGAPMDIPVVGLSFEDAAALTAQLDSGDEVVVRVATSTESDPDATTSNIIASSRFGDKHKRIMVGAHLDGVFAGINDNGSGSSALLEIATEMAKLKTKPRQMVQFAFWGAEENGLLGSQHYVDSLSDVNLRKIKANLNFDMLGSPNYVRFVYDGDGSDTPVRGPAGSAEIESVFTDYFASQGLESEPTEFSGRSDYGPFIAVGIPAGGLFSGAEGVKTEEQAEIYGGTAGEWYDPCYHQVCDDINNLSMDALNEMGDAAAHATWVLARSKEGFFPDGSFRKAPRSVKVAKHHHGTHLAKR
jgi:Zn-dependent M28 family amino/carboxypeptidase